MSKFSSGSDLGVRPTTVRVENYMIWSVFWQILAKIVQYLVSIFRKSGLYLVCNTDFLLH